MMSEFAHNMKRIDSKNAKANFEQTFDNLLLSDELIKIMRDKGNTVLVFEAIWRRMAETLNVRGELDEALLFVLVRLALPGCVCRSGRIRGV
jgi:hypothetical protein